MELIIALNDRSFSGRGRDADLAELSCESGCDCNCACCGCACDCNFSPSSNLFVGDASRGECSSRIDLDRDKILNGFGLPFFATAVPVELGGESPFESRDTSECEGPPTALRATDRSRLDSVCKVAISMATLPSEVIETGKVLPVLVFSFDETLPDMAGLSVSLDILSSPWRAESGLFCKRLELLDAL